MTDTKWCRNAIWSLLRFASKNYGPWDDLKSDGDLPDENDESLIWAAPDMADALRQWQHAEETGDESELANARVSRDKALAKARGKS